MTPREIVRELDKYVIGQGGAKRAVAIALRNRIRRQKLPPEMAEEVMPKNIIMMGPTGVGKTEIARRLEHKYDNVCKWIRRFNEEGIAGLNERPGRGRKSKIKESEALAVVETMLSSPR